ncbi:MAG: MgtC/SapB family protein [Lachnospiraceae bacterium]|nr:MgtC/SapB family protein [Lachnospiraceae bacterium]
MRITDVLMRFFCSFEVQAVIRMALAAIFGFVIGMEREKKGRQAGTRTHAIVCVASCMIMVVAIYLNRNFGTGDVARLPAQVISGVGFLGAGTILVTKDNRIRGLTTAAGLWACACMGVAVGSGFYAGSVGGFLIIFLILHCGKSDKLDGYCNAPDGETGCQSEDENECQQEDETVTLLEHDDETGNMPKPDDATGN